MKKYQQLAEQLREQIASGIWQPGDRLPSLRDGGAFRHELYDCQPCLSVARKSGIYYRTTAVGLLRCATGNKMPKAPVIPVTRDEAVDINTYILICCRPVAIRRSFRLPRPFPTRDFSPPTTKPLAGAGKQNRHGDERD